MTRALLRQSTSVRLKVSCYNHCMEALHAGLPEECFHSTLVLVRRRRRSVEVSPVDSEDLVESISATFVDQSPNPEKSCWRRERTELLAKAINQLGPAMQRTILVRDIQEHSLEETAQLLDMTIHAVKSRVFRGRRELSGMVSRGLPAASPA